MTEAVPRQPADLPAHVRSLLPALPGLARSVAQLLLDDPAGCARLSLAELAERVGGSEATVARTARLLGYRGFRELRLALLAYTAVADVHDESELLGPVSAGDDLPTVIAKLARDEQQSLGDTARTLDVPTLQRVIDLVAGARRVDLYGLMSSGLVAQDLAQKLLRIGIAAQAHTEMHLAITSALHLGPGDVAIAVSHSGSTVEVAEPLEHAGAVGAATVAITGNPRAPMTDIAEHVLFASGGRDTDLPPVPLASRTSQLLVVDFLFVGVALARPGSIEALQISQDTLVPKHRPRGQRPRER